MGRKGPAVTIEQEDWLDPEPPSTSLPAVEPTFDGVIRVDDTMEQGVRFNTLAAALKAAPPGSPESVIYGRDGMLAECDADRCRWVLLSPGHARLVEEASNVVQATMLRRTA